MDSYIRIARYLCGGRVSCFILVVEKQCVTLYFYRTTLPNINKVPSQSTNEDLTLPEGANGRLYGISVMRSSCPPGASTLVR